MASVSFKSPKTFRSFHTICSFRQKIEAQLILYWPKTENRKPMENRAKGWPKTFRLPNDNLLKSNFYTYLYLLTMLVNQSIIRYKLPRIQAEQLDGMLSMSSCYQFWSCSSRKQLVRRILTVGCLRRKFSLS